MPVQSHRVQSHLWDTATDRSQVGTTATTIAGMRHDILVARARDLGVRTLTIGNSQDCVFNPAICFLGQFDDNSTTQIVDTQVSEWFMYQLGLPPILPPQISAWVETHGKVLKEPSVHQRILTFINSLP